MSLRYILQQIAPEVGISLSKDNERALLISRINSAAKELYETKFLFGSILDDVFDINVESNTVTLPWYVKIPRGMRWFDGRYAISLEDIQNRYADSLDSEIWHLKFRSKEKSVLARDITNESRLRFRSIGNESSDVVISVCGATDRSSKWIDKITLPANNGDNWTETTSIFKDPMKFIRKNRLSEYDIEIQDVEGNELGMIPNMLERSEYQVVQILDGETQANTAYDAVEILYETPFVPMLDDDDEFVFGDTYDDAIICKYFEKRSKDKEEGLAYFAKCEKLISDIWKKALIGTKKVLKMPKNPYFQSPYIGGVGYGYKSVDL